MERKAVCETGSQFSDFIAEPLAGLKPPGQTKPSFRRSSVSEKPQEPPPQESKE